MSLYGALFSGVSGLTAQSSAMGAISDNITNVSTIGYKGTSVNFQTLVTKQTSATFYSAGGVQSKPRQQTDVQGLLQASTSQTDISMSGAGFFVVNQANTPGVSDPYLYTRAGSFIQDDQGYLKNSQGYYLQGWPTDASGKVVPANSSLTVSNQNIISSDYLESINLNRVGGTAASTTNVAIGANLPANSTTFDGTLTDITNQLGYQKTDVQFFDSLGNAHNLSSEYLRTANGNQWDLRIEPPAGVAVATLYDQANGTNTSDVYYSAGHLEFTGTRPADGAYVSINGITYEFDNNGSVSTGSTAQVTDLTPGGTIEIGDKFWVTIGGTSVSYTAAAATMTDVSTGLMNAITSNTNLNALVTPTLQGVAPNQTLRLTAKTAGAPFTVTLSTVNGGADATQSLSQATSTSAAGRVRVDVSSNTTLSADLDSLITAVRAADADFSATASDNTFGFTSNNFHKITKERGNSNNIVITGGPNHIGDIVVDVTGLANGTTQLTSQGTAASKNFTIQAVNSYGKTAQVDTVTPANVELNDVFSVTLHGQTVTYTCTGAATVANVTAGLVAAINNNAYLANLVTATNNTSYLSITSDYPGMGFTTTSTTTDGGGTGTQTLTVATTTANSTGAIAFDADGLPASFNVSELEFLNFSNGAQSMSGSTNEGSRITMDFGTVGEANGLTQFGAEFTPAFITQNGSKFGTFAGVTIGTDGLVTALFDNGETRKIFQIPVATFVNPNQLESKSGNVWSATQNSGDYTLRVADTGPAGQVVQSALEASTVDIGAEFTNMIVVQRAYSASTKIISTADQMLEELMRVKR